MKIKQILNSEQLETLLNLYKKLDKETVEQRNNLFNVEITQIPESMFDIEPLVLLRESVNCKESLTHYFVKYFASSFSSLHRDSQTFKNTLVTVLEQNNLKGGDTLSVKMFKKEYPKPIVLRPEVGDTVSYNPNELHGVSEVQEGSRLVLVSWLL